MKRKSSKTKRIVLGTGHPWFTFEPGKGFKIEKVGLINDNGIYFKLNAGDLSSDNKIRLIAEVLE